MLLNASELTSEIKKIAVNAVNSEKPCNIVFGSVISDSPLKINVEQKLTLSQEQLILSRSVTDFQIEISENDYKKMLIVHNKLKAGEKVILSRLQGGQKFVVLDRIGEI